MKDGDISNEIAPKFFFIIEGLVTRISEENTKKAERARRREKWADLISVTDIDTMMTAHLWDIYWRTPYDCEFISVTSGNEAWLERLEKRFDRFNVPYSGLMGFEDEDALARHVVFMPNILRLYHGHPDWRFKFGQVGEYIGDPQVFQVS